MLDEFMQHVTLDASGCWLWKGRADRYGSFRSQPAHRAAWELHQGPIPDGLIILHGCDVKGCVNPSHLRPGTQRQNAEDKTRARRSGPHGTATKVSYYVPRAVQDQIFMLARERRMSASALVTEVLTDFLAMQPAEPG